MSSNEIYELYFQCKGTQKNMLKTWDFTKNKLCHRYFDSNLQKIFRTNILKNGTGQILFMLEISRENIDCKS